jgi:hypothetical protein
MGIIAELGGGGAVFAVNLLPVRRNCALHNWRKPPAMPHILTAADPESNLTLPRLPNKISKGDQNLVKKINLSAHLNLKRTSHV